MTDKEAQLELAQARETEEARAIFAALAADPIALPFISTYSPDIAFFVL